MTFDPTKWNTISGQMKRGDAYQKFSYKGDVDTITTIAASGYFNDARHDLSRYDIIEVNDLLSSPKQYMILLVTARPLSGDIVTTIIEQGESVKNIITIDTLATIGDIYDYVLLNPDIASFPVQLPVGSQAKTIRLLFIGTVGNYVDVHPAGSELLFGVNALSQFYDGEVIDLVYDLEEGWR